MTPAEADALERGIEVWVMTHPVESLVLLVAAITAAAFFFVWLGFELEPRP